MAVPRLSNLQFETNFREDMVLDPVFKMEFSAFGSDALPAGVASGGCDPDGSRGVEAVEKWW
jgi:hypothetical protein